MRLPGFDRPVVRQPVDEAGPSLGVVLDQTRAAATAGFDGVWLNQRTSRDALTTLAIMGREVPDIEFGTAVVPTCLRRPLALAAQALTVRAAVGGRMALDVGVGHQVVVEGQYGYSMHAAVITPRGPPAPVRRRRSPSRRRPGGCRGR
ncbi:LLM class flavin-dependent oxidoreductase [Streptomyces sp. SAI-129]|uniref:LLM class flavin-dependent oxidoreductase n=1 Tax=Streptomyces sp. SAI-129 TaxID=3377727 RepID=UPI003C7DA530